MLFCYSSASPVTEHMNHRSYLSFRACQSYEWEARMVARMVQRSFLREGLLMNEKELIAPRNITRCGPVRLFSICYFPIMTLVWRLALVTVWFWCSVEIHDQVMSLLLCDNNKGFYFLIITSRFSKLNENSITGHNVGARSVCILWCVFEFTHFLHILRKS